MYNNLTNLAKTIRKLGSSLIKNQNMNINMMNKSIDYT